MTDVEQVKSRIDITEYIGSKVQLKSAGHNLKGLCPFHQEKSASFMVNPDMQIYKCFGCGKGGDIFNFIQEFEGVGFSEALQMAAEHIGYELQGGSSPNEQTRQERATLLSVNKLAMQYWYFVLNKHDVGKPGREYLKKRGIRQAEVDKFKMGYAPPGTNLIPFLHKKGFSTKNLVKWGLAVNRNGKLYDKFRDRLILPILDLKGQPIGFSGRMVTPSDYAPKYLNSSDSPVYRKSEILMGLYQAKDAARHQRKLILQEGNLDLMASHKVGIEYIAATGGTAVTQQQLKLVKRYADTVLFCFDTDAAGQKALINALGLAENIGLQHKVIDLLNYKDPDDLIQSDPRLWQKQIHNAKNTIEYLFQRLSNDLDLGTADGKSELVKRIVPILQHLQDEIQLQHFVNKLAVEVGVSQSVISDLIKQTPQQVKIISKDSKNQKQMNPMTDSPSSREIYFLALLAATSKFEQISKEVDDDLFLDKINQQVWDVIFEHKSSHQSYVQLSNNLSAEADSRLQHVLTLDLENLANQGEIEKEIHRVLRLLSQARLRRQVLKMREELKKDPDNDTLLQKLSTLSAKLQQLDL